MFSRPKSSGGFRFGIHARLTAIFVAFFGLTLVSFSALVYRELVSTHQNEFDAALYNYAVDVVQAVNFDLFGDLAVRRDLLQGPNKVFPFTLGKALILIRTPEGRIAAGSGRAFDQDLPYDAKLLHELRKNRVLFETLDLRLAAEGFGSASYRVIHYLVQKPLTPTLILQVAVPLSLLDKEKRGIIAFFALTVPLLLVLAAVGGYFFAGRALVPVKSIIEKARTLGAGNLGERVPVPEVRDEIRELSETINGLLDRLQMAFQSQERFVADASHQLKTPLAILRGELDLIRGRARSESEIQDFLASASQEIDYLAKIVGDLLILARVDAGTASLSIQPVRMDEVVIETVSRLERFAAGKGIRLRLNLLPASDDKPFEVIGDDDLLSALVGNLVENAVKYAPGGTDVDVQVSDRVRDVLVEVTDRGPGIPVQEQAQVFERFFRGGSNVPGVGLGLAIARKIADAHRASIELRSEQGQGATFVVRLPKAAAGRRA